MRKYFIDYFQLWFPFAREEMKDPNVKVEIKNVIANQLFNNNLRSRIISRPHLSLESFFHMHFHQGGLILHLRGLYFDSNVFEENINQIYCTLKVIYDMYKKDFDFTNVTVSRIDLACNVPLFLNTNEFKIFKSNNSLEEAKWYIGKSEPINMTGYVIGKRGKYGLQLSVYDKRYSPNQNDDHRFDTYNYSRIEYKIGRRYLKNKLELGTPKDFRKFEHQYPEQVIKYCTERSALTFVQESRSKAFWSCSDFRNAIGREVEDSTAKPIRVIV